MSFEISPVKLVYGGEALGYVEGQTVFVSAMLPGERAEAEAVRAAKGVVHARPLRILDPAPERVEAPCPYFGVCGGCQYQHIASQNQTKWKVEILRETLRRIGKITWDSEITVHQAAAWNYRNQAELKIARTSAGPGELGFYEAESHRLVAIDRCLILSPRLNEILTQLREPAWLSRLGEWQGIELLADDRDEKVTVTLRGGFGGRKAEALAGDLLSGIEGAVCVAFDDGRSRQAFGQPALGYRVGDFEYKVSAGSFFQASRFLIPRLVSAATVGPGGALALDLYAGVGLFSLPLASKFERVIAVESNPGAVRDLEENARAAGAPNLRAAAESSYDFLRRYARLDPDLVILDPPRAGVGKATLDRLAELRPKRLHYVSCHPPTWARDLGALALRGYRITAIEMFDFFPQTYHIESVARLERSA